MIERRPYGDKKDQYITLRLPTGGKPHAATVFVHGGYWRERFTSSLMSPLEEKFLEAGWMTINIEYRRGPDNHWPIPSNDVSDAMSMAAQIADDCGVGGRVVSVGHSVGGQLVLLNHRFVDAVVALAPVTDAARVYTEGLGDNAAEEYFRTSPASRPDLFRAASPIAVSPPAAPTLIVQGTLDDRVPPQHTESYLQAIGSHVRVEVLRSNGAGHIDLIDPAAEHWTSTVEWMSNTVS
ncbi:alpha/beta hydrolase family protein [Brevibacterium linens]|uniref:alpha/beta hydrolase family protein n=1 Tax=Brevibacterium linens TaxID=1703 RepID=UPI003BF59ADE